MLGDVEVTCGEREIDRIDVFERGRKKREVREGERQRQRRKGGSNHWTARSRKASFRLPRR